MGIIGGSLRSRSSDESTLKDPKAWLLEALGGVKTKSGVRLNEDAALSISTVWACVRAISEDVSKIPFKVYRRVGDGKLEVPGHRVHYLLNRQSNDEFVTGMGLREFVTMSAMLWGNGYAEIERDRAGRPYNLWQLDPRRVKVRRRQSDNAIVYDVTDLDGMPYEIEAEDMLHVRGPGDALVGWSVVKIARESMGLTVAMEQFGAQMFGNGAKPAGFLESPNALDDKAIARLAEWRDRVFGGIDNAHKVHILEQGLKWTPMTMPPEDAQFLQGRQFQVPEICRWFRMKPHKVADLTRATNNNIEHQDLEYVGDCMQGWFSRWEGEVWQKLFLTGERDSLLAEHLAEGLLRGDQKSRYDAYKTGLQWGWITINEIRRRENMNVLPAEIGDVHFFAQNMTTVARLVETSTEDQPVPEPSPGGSPQDRAVAIDRRQVVVEVVNVFREMLRDGVDRIVRTEVDKARRAVSHGDLDRWFTDFSDRHEDHLRSFWVGPTSSIRRLCVTRGIALEERWAARAAEAAARSQIASMRRDLGIEPRAQVDHAAVLDRWGESRGAEIVDGLAELLAGVE